MKALLTGMNGTVAPALANRLTSMGIEVAAWDRSAVPTDDQATTEAFIRETSPDGVFHIATGSPDWAADIAGLCAEDGIPFLFTGSVSVFDGSKTGPYALNRTPDATDDYGRYKFECEERVLCSNPNTIIARLAWQIGREPGSNNMIDFLTNKMNENGFIEASSKWSTSCCFLEDTCEVLHGLMSAAVPGLYQIEGNPGISFYEIVTRLNELHGNPWKVVETDSPSVDNRMLDARLTVRPITERFQMS